MSEKLNLSTEKGCRKILAILLCVVLLSSFFAQLISSNFGSIKISTLTIDSRGAELDIDLYVKRNVSEVQQKMWFVALLKTLLSEDMLY